MKIIICIILVILVGCSSTSKKGPTYDGVSLGTCPASPNCVTSLDKTDEKHYMDAFQYDISRGDAKSILIDILEDEKNSEIIQAGDSYIHVIVKSGVFKFIDDLEFLLPEEENLIHFRSAARSGYSDFGVNRKRMEGIKKKFNERALEYKIK